MRAFLPAIANDLMPCFQNIDFAMVYIEEAHAVDEWPIRSGRYHGNVPVNIEQPRTLAQRIAVAKAFLAHYNVAMQTLVDSPEAGNPFEKAFAPWPIRFYVIRGGAMTFIAEPTYCEYSLSELTRFLEGLN